MAFNVPIQQSLTESQNEALSKLISLNNNLYIPFRRFLTRPKSEQISLLDFLTKISDAVLGAGYIDNLIMTFINKLFDKGSEDLEKLIIKAIAKALDAKPITIKSGLTNQEWLEQNVQQELHVAMEILKAMLIKKILILIYGPKDRIKPLELPPNSYNNFYLTQNYNDLNPDDYLNNASLQDVMFTTINTVSNSFGDIEYNIIKIREQLEKGNVTFTVSCQDVKINLPQSILQSADAIIDNNIQVYLQGPNPIPSQQITYQNPTGVLVDLNGYVDNETQRINSEENAAAVKKSWIRILLDKIINLLPLVLYPILQKILDKINLEIQQTAGGQTGANANNTNTTVNEQVGTSNGTNYHVISATMTTTIVPGSIKVWVGSEEFIDNLSGSLTGNAGGSGNINYNTGIGSINTTLPISSGTIINAEYQSTPPTPFSVNVPLLTVENTLGLLTSIKDDAKSNRNLFDKNSTFYRIIMNGLYALILSFILRKVVPKITKLIAKALAKRKARRAQRKFKRMQEKAKLLMEQAKELEKKAEAGKALKALNVVYDYIKNA